MLPGNATLFKEAMIVKLDAGLIVKFFKFGCIGGVVFVFDASCFWLLIHLLGVPGLARAISVLLAMTLSWWLNRRFTFHASANRANWSELVKFMLSQLPGACINALISVVAFTYLAVSLNNPWISTALGSCAGLVANFVMANFFVFGKKTAP